MSLNPDQFKIVYEKNAQYNLRRLTLRDQKEGVDLASVTFQHYNEDNMEPSSRIEIDYLKSHREGQGHAQRLMEHMYNRYPKSHIDWGLTVNPTSTHLASKFEDKYYDRTSYQQQEELS